MFLHSETQTTILVTNRKNRTMKHRTANRIDTEARKHRVKLSVQLSVAATACLTFSSCGGIAEKITEEGAERLIEAESGEDVELDFDSGDGSFSLETESGGFSLDEDGNFVVTDEDGSVFTGSASGDGEILVEGENGEGAFRVVTDIPDEWPSNIPRPEGLTIEGGSYITADGETMMAVIGSPSGSAIDYTQSYLATVAAAGFTETGSFDSTQDGSTTIQRTYEDGEWTLNINGYQDGDSNIVNISILSTAD